MDTAASGVRRAITQWGDSVTSVTIRARNVWMRDRTTAPAVTEVF